MTTENNKKENIVPKSVKERNNLDLLELVCQLHYRALQYGTKDLHDAYVEARTELESRFPATLPSIEGGIKSKEEVLKEIYIHHTNVVNPDGNWATWEECKKDGTLQLAYDAMEAYASQFTRIASDPEEWRKHCNWFDENGSGLKAEIFKDGFLKGRQLSGTASKEKEYRELLEEVDYYLSAVTYEKGKPVYHNNIGAGSINK